MARKYSRAITDVPGFLVGHAHDLQAATGCTVIICPPRTIGGVDIRGSAAGTRQIDSLHSFHAVDEVHAVLLSGGSAFGLDASGGVMKYLEEKGLGYQTSAAKVPIVPTAIIYDLGLGNGQVRPDKEMAYRACLESHAGEVAEGSVGVGAGASVGKLLGINFATKGGVGTSSVFLPEGIIVGALVVVNAFGDVIDPQNGKVLAGTRDPNNPQCFLNSSKLIREGLKVPQQETTFQNTTLGVVATNVRLTKRQAIKVAQMAQSGFVRTISPIHSTVDGDLIFALSCGELRGDINTIGLLAEEVIAQAVLRAIINADGLGFLPSFRDLLGQEKK